MGALNGPQTPHYNEAAVYGEIKSRVIEIPQNITLKFKKGYNLPMSRGP